MSSDTDKYAGRIVRWLEGRREHVAEVMADNDLPLTASRAVHLVDFAEGGSWSTRTLEERVSGYRLGTPAAVVGILIDEEGEDLARALAVAYARTLSPGTWGPRALHHWADDRLIHEASADPQLLAAALTLLNVCGEYLRRLESADHADTERAGRLADEAITLCASLDVQEVAALPVGGMQVQESIHRHDVTLRKLSAREAGNLLQAGSLVSSEGSLPLNSYAFLAERCVLECREIVAKSEGLQPSASQVRKVVLAAQLHGIHLAGVGMCFVWREPRWFFNWVTSTPISVRQHLKGAASAVDSDTLAQWMETSTLVSESVFEQPTEAPDVALRRFALAEGRDSAVDALVDYVVALEGVLLPGLRDELRHRFGLNGAWWLGGDADERRELFDTLRDLYDLRSRLVHGGGGHAPLDEISAKRDDARVLAARALLKCLTSRWPRAGEFDQLLLEG